MFERRLQRWNARKHSYRTALALLATLHYGTSKSAYDAESPECPKTRRLRALLIFRYRFRICQVNAFHFLCNERQIVSKGRDLSWRCLSLRWDKPEVWTICRLPSVSKIQHFHAFSTLLVLAFQILWGQNAHDSSQSHLILWLVTRAEII